MSVAAIAVVRNEQDIIEPFVRHTLKFVDALSVMDNGSVDGTKEILAKLNAEFPLLVVSHDDNFSDTIADRANNLMRQCRGINFVVPLDADEFIASADRREFNAHIGLIPSGGYGIVPWQTFVVAKGVELEAAVNPPWTIRYARKRELPQFNKVIVRLEGQDPNDVVLFTGSHEVGTKSHRQMPCVNLPTKLWHYPVRSREQIIGKACVNWMSYCAHNPNARHGVANYHKREIFDAIVSGKKIDVAKLSFLYAQDEREIVWKDDVEEHPVLFDYVRKYSTGDPMPAIHLIMKSWEQWMAKR